MNIKLLVPACIAVVWLAACGRNEDSATTAGSSTAANTPPPDTADAAPPAMAMAGASVKLSPTQGNTAAGSLTVSTMGGGVHLSGTLQGLPPNGEFGFHIHEKGDCSAPDASSAGEHFNPTNAQHGSPQGAAHHAGDMLNMKSDGTGNAQVEAHVSGVSLRDGQAADVFGKAVVVHEKPDDYATQPSGNSGARIACGVIN